MKPILALALALSCTGALAAEAYVGTATFHPLTTEPRNEDNQLVIVSHDGWLAGTMINSFEQRTWVVGKTWQTSRDGFYLGAGAVLTYGYCWESLERGRQFSPVNCDQAVIPAPILTIGYGEGPIAFQLFAAGTAINTGIQVRF